MERITLTADEILYNAGCYRSDLIRKGVILPTQSPARQVTAFADHLQTFLPDRVSRSLCVVIARTFIHPSKRTIRGQLELAKRYNKMVGSTTN